jgi:hypothetical protein
MEGTLTGEATARQSRTLHRQAGLVCLVMLVAMLSPMLPAQASLRFDGPHVWKNWPNGLVTCIQPGHVYNLGIQVKTIGTSTYTKTKWTRVRSNGTISHFTSYPQWAGGWSFDGFGMPYKVLLGTWRATALRDHTAVWRGKLVIRRC